MYDLEMLKQYSSITNLEISWFIKKHFNGIPCFAEVIHFDVPCEFNSRTIIFKEQKLVVIGRGQCFLSPENQVLWLNYRGSSKSFNGL